VLFELNEDALGERVLVAKVLEGPANFRRAELEGWHIKTINDKPIGKIKVSMVRTRLRKGVALAFQDPVIDDHLSGPQMILEHFINWSMLTTDVDGNEISWAKEAKDSLMEEARAMQLPANAMDQIMDQLGGLRKVAEMSGRSHRMKRRKDGTFAYVARCEELRCPGDGANMVEQVLFQKGTKKICVVTEVASAGISLHADRRQVRPDFQPPRRTMISVELPWGADKAIQVFGRVHRANQLIPPKFVVLNTPLGGEMRFNSAIARRMKLLGAVTKGDRMTSMGGVGDRHMMDFDVNNIYGERALATFYADTAKAESAAPVLLALYEALPFIGAEGDGEATGRWPTWEDFVVEANKAWTATTLHEELAGFEDRRAHSGTKECQEINRFFNRILMLEVDVQNAMFETFFAIYTELVRVDKANGVYDEGIENLNFSQGRSIQKVEVVDSAVLYKDPASGAETRYLKLSLDRGISWEAAKEAYDAMPKTGGSIEGFYAYRRTPESSPVYLLVKEMLQLGGAGSSGTTWISRRRKKQFCVWRADSGAKTGISVGRVYYETDFAEEQYERLSSEKDLEQCHTGWEELYEDSAARRLGSEHILTGDVLMAWRLVQSSKRKDSKKMNPEDDNAEEDVDMPAVRMNKLQIVRAITQPAGQPVVGMRLVEEDLPLLRYILSVQQAMAEEALTADKTKVRIGIREATYTCADLLLKKLWNLPDNAMDYTSWLEVHKLVSEEGVPKSMDGLRATQIAVQLLEETEMITVEEGRMKLGAFVEGRPVTQEADLEKELTPPPTGERLEQQLFPQEFEEIGYELSDEESGEEDEEEEIPEEPVKPSKVSDIPTPAKTRKPKESSKSRKGKEAAKEEKSAAKPRERKRKPSRRTTVDAENDGKGVEVPDDIMFQELFGDSDDEFEDFEQELAEALGLEEDASRKRQRDEDMSKALFGDFGDEDSDDAPEKRSKVEANA